MCMPELVCNRAGANVGSGLGPTAAGKPHNVNWRLRLGRPIIDV